MRERHPVPDLGGGVYWGPSLVGAPFFDSTEVKSFFGLHVISGQKLVKFR